MNWTPGRIVGTVKPAGAAVEPISTGMVLPVPAPAPLPVHQNVTVVAPVPKPVVPAGTVAPAAAPVTGTAPIGGGLLKGIVQAGGSGGDKIVGTVNIAGSSKPGLSSEELTQKAINEIHRDVQRGRIRADQVGALGWRECPLKKTNKRFLSRTVNSVLQHNKRETLRNFYSSTRKLIELEDRRDEGRMEGRGRGAEERTDHHRRRRRSRSRSRSREDQRDRRRVDKEKKKTVKVDLVEEDELEDGEVRDDDD